MGPVVCQGKRGVSSGVALGGSAAAASPRPTRSSVSIAQKCQEGYAWLTFYRDSATMQVEPVATSKAPPSNDVNRGRRPWQQHSQEQLGQAFDVDRIIGTEEPQPVSPPRRLPDLLGHGVGGNVTRPCLVQVTFVLFHHMHACEVVTHGWRLTKRNPSDNPTPSPP